MTDFLIQNIETLGAAFAALVLIIYAVITKQWAVLQAAAYSFMLQAERLMATKEGKDKMEEVFAATWAKLPKNLKLFVTEKTLRDKLQEWYNLAAKEW